MQYKDLDPVIQLKVMERQKEQGNKPNLSLNTDTSANGGGFNWNHTIEGHEFWFNTLVLDNHKKFFDKYPKQQGLKCSNDKLPVFTVLMKQFPMAFEEVVKCSKAGHEKYLEGDEDWQNFSRVKGGSDTYKEAALRHLKESVNKTYNEDMEDYGKIRHLGQFCWNALAALELELREENKSNDPLMGIHPLQEVSVDTTNWSWTYSRPTLSVDQLLNKEETEDYYPDTTI